MEAHSSEAVVVRTRDRAHKDECMIHSSPEWAGVIHPDRGCDIKADSTVSDQSRIEVRGKKKPSNASTPSPPWGPISPPAARSSTDVLFLLQLEKLFMRKWRQPNRKYARRVKQLLCSFAFLRLLFLCLYYELYYTFGISIFSNWCYFVALIGDNMNSLKECTTVQVPALPRLFEFRSSFFLLVLFYFYHMFCVFNRIFFIAMKAFSELKSQLNLWRLMQAV